MMYCFREREQLLNVNEMLAGFRMFPSYLRIGGLREDLPTGFHEAVKKFLDAFPAQAGRIRRPAHQEPDLAEADEERRRDDRGRRDQLRARRADGARGRRPLRRPQGVPVSRLRDLRLRRADADRRRRLRPLPGAGRGDAREHARSRSRRSRASRRAASSTSRTTASSRRRRTRSTREMEALIQHFLIYSQGFNVPAGEAYVPIEGPRGEHGFSIVSDGTNRPYRIKLRAPSFYACQALPKLIDRRHDCRRHRRHRLDRRRHGRRGSMSFHPLMVYDERFQKSERKLVDEGRAVHVHAGAPGASSTTSADEVSARAEAVGGARGALSACRSSRAT